MRVHHLNCATLRPIGGALLGGAGTPLRRVRIVTHVLLLELHDRLILVDTGLGLGDVDGSRGPRHARFLKMLLWADLAREEPAVVQLARLGFDPCDVSDVVLTHLDPDHAGGLADFPRATVHVDEIELAAATRRASVSERIRYAPIDWAHGPRWRTYGAELGRWRDQPAHAVRDSIWLVPLRGHTRGHAAVAIELADGPLLFVGDAVVSARELTEGTTLAWTLFQRHISSVDDRSRQRERDRLAVLAPSIPDLRVVATHDTELFDLVAAPGREAA